MTAAVLYNNLLDYPGATVTYTHEQDNSGKYAHDWLLHSRWTPGTSAAYALLTLDLGQQIFADTIAIFGHNLGTTQSRIILSTSDNGTTFHSRLTVEPTDDTPIFFPFTQYSQGARYYRVAVMEPTTSTHIHHIQIGKRLDLKPLSTGFKPPMFETYTATNNINRQGVLLGRSIRKSARKMTISQKAITPTEMETDFVPWLEHASRLPFLFCWDRENRPEDTVYCWLEKNAPDPVYSNLCYLSLQMKVQAMSWRELPEA